jgi:hypothetical protein
MTKLVGPLTQLVGEIASSILIPTVKVYGEEGYIQLLTKNGSTMIATEMGSEPPFGPHAVILYVVKAVVSRVGVPEIVPVDPSNWRPVGSEPFRV